MYRPAVDPEGCADLPPLVRIFGICVTIVLVGQFFLLAVNAYLADSEIWTVSLSQQFGESNSTQLALYYKPLFHFILRMLFFLPLENWDTFIAARLLFAAIGITAVAIAVGLTAKNVCRVESALLAGAALLSTSFFLNRGFRVRSDILMAAVNLAVVAILLKCKKRASGGSPFLSLFFVSAALALTTPKSAYFFCANSLWIYVVFPKNLRKRVLLWMWMPVGIGLVVAIAVYGWWQDVLFDSLRAAGAFFFGLFRSGFGVHSYGSWESLFYVIKFGCENPIYILMMVLSSMQGGAVILQRVSHKIATRYFWRKTLQSLRRGKTSQVNAWHFYSLLTVGILLVHNDKLPFFIAALLPSAVMGVALIFEKFMLWMPKKRRAVLYGGALFVCLVQGSFFFREIG